MADPLVTVVLPTVGRACPLRRALAGLAAQVSPPWPWELVVVDNARSPRAPVPDDALGQLRRAGVRASLIRHPVPGACSARNAGIAAAAGRVVAFLDDDVVPEASWLVGIAGPVLEDGAGLVGGRVVLDPAARRPRWLGPCCEGFLSAYDRGDHQLDVPAEDHVLTANAACRRDLLVALGGFDPVLGPRPGAQLVNDDVDLCRRVRAAGHRVSYAPGAVVVHDLPASRATIGYLMRRCRDQGRSDWLLDRATLRSAPGRGAGGALRHLYHEQAHLVKTGPRTLDAGVRVVGNLARVAGFLAEAASPSAVS